MMFKILVKRVRRWISSALVKSVVQQLLADYLLAHREHW